MNRSAVFISEDFTSGTVAKPHAKHRSRIFLAPREAPSPSRAMCGPFVPQFEQENSNFTDAGGGACSGVTLIPIRDGGICILSQTLDLARTRS